MNSISQKCLEILKRKSDCHKGDFGHVLIAGGDFGMFGAPIMAAQAAYRCGAGKVTVLTKEENFNSLVALLPNAMTAKIEDGWQKVLANKTVIALGMGLGKSEWSRQIFEEIMKSNLPKVIDADGLNLLAESQKKFDLKNSILTPHVGEAARLLAVSTDEIQKDRNKAAKKLHEKFGAVIVLKGKNSLIYGEKLNECEFGNPGMAVAGMGDTLSGIIAALLAQHVGIEESANLGVNIHGFAADLVAKKQGEIGMVPNDLLTYLPLIINGKI